MKVKLGDVVNKVVENVDRLNTDLVYYIGGEHINSESICIYSGGLLDSDKGKTLGYQFQFRFQKDDVLFMTKNPYLKKCAKVCFDGICSIATFVLRTKDDGVLLQYFLPVLLQTSDFWNYLEANKSGSVNYFITWKTLSAYEFELPTIEEQRRIADLAWSIERTKVAYENLLHATDELVKSQFMEQFCGPGSRSKYETIDLGNISNMISGGTPSSKHPEFFGGNIPFLSTPCLGPNYIDASAAQNWLTELGVEKSSTHIVPEYSLMVGNRVGVGKCSINTCAMCTNQDILSFVDIDTEKYDLLFVKKVIEQYGPFFESQKRGATIKGIPSDLVKASQIPLAPIDIQREFVAFVNQTDKSKFELTQALEALNTTYKKLISENLG